MFSLSSIYRPITAHPFMNNETYVEILPCEELRPYICCFWGSPKPWSSTASSEITHWLVIPDTCMDIIINTDKDKNELKDHFNGINDFSFDIQSQSSSSAISSFAIRFYSWAVPLFSGESMKNALNASAEVEAYFKNFKRDFQDILVDNILISDRIQKAEQYLLKKLNINRQNNDVMNAVYKLLKSKGTANISELSEYTAVSQRQLERLFPEYIGIPPKKLSDLIRYQYLWQDLIYNGSFDVQDAVCKYGYSDQPHLLNDFKKYHTMNPSDARKYAYNIR